MVLEVDCRARHAPLNELLKALVRHKADPGLPLAEVLGVQAEDIRLTDCPE
jgi:hypothetical protein